MTDNIPDRDKVEEAAAMVTNLLQFSALLIPYLELLEQNDSATAELSGHTAALAPVIGAVGGDWETAQLEADIRTKRSRAIVNLVRVLKETEADRVKHAEKMKSKQAGIEQLRRAGVIL